MGDLHWNIQGSLLTPATTPRDHNELCTQIDSLQLLVRDVETGLKSVAGDLSVIQMQDSKLEDRVDRLEAHFQLRITQLQGDVASILSRLDSIASKQDGLLLQRHQQQTLSPFDSVVKFRQHQQQLPHSQQKFLSPSSDRDSGVTLPTRSSDISSSGQASPDQYDYACMGGGPPASKGGIGSARKTSPPPIKQPQNLDDEDGYQSDSSVTRVANESLRLCDSLQERCLHVFNDEDSDDTTEDDAELYDVEEPPPDFESKRAGIENENDTLYATASSFFNQLTPPVTEKKTSPVMKSSQSKSVTIRGSPESSDEEAIEVKLRQRFMAVTELVDTERSFCNGLWNLQENCVEPLRVSGLIPEDQLSIIFPDVLWQIYEQHCILLHKFEERFARWQPDHSQVADIFVKLFKAGAGILPKFYYEYIAAFPKSIKAFQKNFKQPKVRKFLLKQCRLRTMRTRAPKQVVPLQVNGFLLSPVQRIPRYVLLLKEIQKYTPKSHPDFESLGTAMNELRKFLDEMQNVLHENESKNNAVENLDMVPPGTPVKPRRRKYRMATTNALFHRTSYSGSWRSSGSSSQATTSVASSAFGLSLGLGLGQKPRPKSTAFMPKSEFFMPISPSGGTLTPELDYSSSAFDASPPTVLKKANRNNSMETLQNGGKTCSLKKCNKTLFLSQPALDQAPSIVDLSHSMSFSHIPEDLSPGDIFYYENSAVKYRKKGGRKVSKNIAAMRNSLMAFFSKKKNERTFAAISRKQSQKVSSAISGENFLQEFSRKQSQNVASAISGENFLQESTPNLNFSDDQRTSKYHTISEHRPVLKTTTSILHKNSVVGKSATSEKNPTSGKTPTSGKNATNSAHEALPKKLKIVVDGDENRPSLRCSSSFCKNGNILKKTPSNVSGNSNGSQMVFQNSQIKNNKNSGGGQKMPMMNNFGHHHHFHDKNRKSNATMIQIQDESNAIDV